MFDLRPVLYVFSLALVACGLFELLPGFVEWAYGHDDAPVYFASAAVAVFVGGALAFTTHQEQVVLNLRQAFLLTPLCWFGLPVFASLPFVFTDSGLDFTDAYFETVSGFTTTGATVMVGLDDTRPGLLLWRAILQWLGGIGIIMVAVAILPFLRVGGMQIMRTESSDRSDKILPRASQIAGAIARLYLGLTVLCIVAYWACGMRLFDAVTHALTTVSTAGFSTSDRSLAAFPAATHWVAVIFMLLGALPFVLLVKTLQGDRRALLGDAQVRGFLYAVGTVVLLTTAWLLLHGDYVEFEPALRAAAVNIISVVTTTGYASADYQSWGNGMLPFFIFLMLMGGCTGSTSGSIKIFRWQILLQESGRQIAQMADPHRVLPHRYNGRPIPSDVPGSVGLFVFLFFALILVFTALLTAVGLDFVTAVSGATTMLSNVGPGLGPIIGPTGTFQPLPDSAKWICSFAMVMGRLELLTVLVLFDWRYWKR